MSSIRILITGGSGLLGQYLSIELSKYFDILTVFNSNRGNTGNYNSRQVDINETNDIEAIFNDFHPHIVIHAAAMNISISEDKNNFNKVYQTNVIATESIARICEKIKAKLIYLSTDLVYAGYRGSLLKEDSKLVPVSLYAETKLMGEMKIRAVFDNYIILRTSVLYGFGINHSYSHFDHMYDKLLKGENVRLFKDQFRSPISLIEASRMIRNICSLECKEKIFNFGGIERISRYELGLRLCKISGLDSSLIEPIFMRELKGYPAVEDVSMDVSHLLSFGIQSKRIDESIEEILKVGRL